MAADAALSGRGSLQLLVGGTRDREDPGGGGARHPSRGSVVRACTGGAAAWTRALRPTGPGSRRSASTPRDADPVALAWQLGGGARDVAQLVPDGGREAEHRALRRLGQRGGPLPPLRLGDQPADGGRPGPADRDHPRRPPLGRRAVAPSAPLRGARGGVERPADPRHLSRRRARPPPSTGTGARGAVGQRGQRPRRAPRAVGRSGRALCGDDRRWAVAARTREGRPRPGPTATHSSSARSCACSPARATSPERAASRTSRFLRACGRSSVADSIASVRRPTRRSGSPR